MRAFSVPITNCRTARLMMNFRLLRDGFTHAIIDVTELRGVLAVGVVMRESSSSSDNYSTGAAVLSWRSGQIEILSTMFRVISFFRRS